VSAAAPRPAADPAAFIRANTDPIAPPLVPEMRLHLATETLPIWRLTEEELAAEGLPPPFWAFAWAGGQALARYLLDNPELVAGRRVLDFAAGSGIVGIAAAKAGAAHVRASEIDAFAVAAVAVNAALNGVAIAAAEEDIVGRTDLACDLVLAGDVCYEKLAAERIIAWLRGLAAAGATVLMGDPKRSYFPGGGLERLAEYRVPVSRELEDMAIRRTAVWRVLA